MSRSSRRSSAVVKISAADIERVRAQAPEAIAYYQRFGLAGVRSRAIAIAASGAVPIIGLLLLGWSPTAMLIFLLIDALITVLNDLLRLPLAARWMRASHRIDFESGQVLGIIDGLEDGSGTRSPRGAAPSPGVIVFFGAAASLFLVPIVGAALEPLGLASVREVLTEPYFPWLVAADAAMRLIGGLRSAIAARSHKPGEVMIFAESGGVAVLYAGLLILVWLPLNWGQPGLILMFAVLYLTRLAFGIFALWWTPRAVATMERRVAANDFRVRSPDAASAAGPRLP
jgi:hypothetical protein